MSDTSFKLSSLPSAQHHFNQHERKKFTSCVAVTSLAPLILGVDWAVPVHVGTVLVHELVHTLALQLAATSINTLLILQLP